MPQTGEMGVCSALGACLRKTTTGAIICQSNPRPSQKAVCYILSPSYHHWKLSGQRAFVIDFPHFSYLFSIILALLLVIVSTKLFLQSPCFSFVAISTEVEELTFSIPLKKKQDLYSEKCENMFKTNKHIGTRPSDIWNQTSLELKMSAFCF